MQIRENWTELSGQVVATAPAPDRQGMVQLTLDVAAVQPVPGFAELSGAVAGDRVDVLLKAPVAVAPGTHIRLKVRRGGPSRTLFAHPDGPVIDGGC